MTPKESLDEKIFDMRIAGFNDAYTYLDFYPVKQKDGKISAPVYNKVTVASSSYKLMQVK